MRESIRLELPAAVTALPTLRMLLGGLAVRLDFSLEELEDLSLAATELLRATLDSEGPESWAVEMAIVAEALHVSAGPYRSPDLRRRLQGAPGGPACLDLCRLLTSTVDSFELVDDGEGFRVTMVKGRRPA